MSSNQQLRPQSSYQSVSQQQSTPRPQSAQSQKKLKTGLIAGEVAKDKSHPFFKDSKVQCCTYVKIEGGVPKAVPCYTKPQLTWAEKMGKFGVKESVSQEQFKLQSSVSASSHKKPLCRYNPNAARNQIAQPSYKLPKSNVSSIVFGDEKAAFKTSNTYGSHANVGFTSNPQVLAHMTKQLQSKLQK